MAGLSEDILKKLITPNAKALSSPKGDEFIDEGRVGSAGDFDDSMFLAETYNESGEMTPERARALTDYSSNDFNPARVKSTKMNSAILEDMVRHPIDTTALNAQRLESANGNLNENMNRFSRMVAGAKMVDQRAKELQGDVTQGRRVAGSSQKAGPGIDYALIKTIVNECLEVKLNEIAQRGLLNESNSIKAIGLSAGKIKIVDNKGNIYSAKLEYQGNTKDKK